MKRSKAIEKLQNFIWLYDEEPFSQRYILAAKILDFCEKELGIHPIKRGINGDSFGWDEE